MTAVAPLTAAPQLVPSPPADLAESPRWDETTDTLWWIDAQAGRLLGHAPAAGRYRQLDLGRPLGGLVLTDDGRGLLTAGHALLVVDLSTGHPGAYANLARAAERDGFAADFTQGSRLNDIAADPQGRALTGTMREDGSGRHYLYSVTPAASGIATVRTVASGVTTSNGIAFSPDGLAMYHADTAARRVRAYPYNPATGLLGEARTAIRTPWPDGIAVDSCGRVWVAHWYGSKVTVWDPDEGRLLDTIKVPAGHVTACAFGGPDLADLYVTTARTGLDAAALSAYPDSGRLFRIPTDAHGTHQHRARVAVPTERGV